MSTHALVTGVLAVTVLGLGAFVVTRPPPAQSAGDAEAELVERIDALERKLEKSSETVRSLRRTVRRTGPSAETPAATVLGDAAPPDASRMTAVEARLTRLEKRVTSVAATAAAGPAKPVDPSTLDNKSLYARAMSLKGSNGVRNNPNKDYGTEVGYWENLLARDIADEQRDTGLYNLGIAYRSLKDHAKEAETFEALIEHAGGIETERGASAGFQLGWARWYQGDHSLSLETMDQVARSPAVSPILQYHALFRAGESAMKIDDPRRAREFFQRVVDDHGASIMESQKWLLDRTKKYIAEIDKR